MAILPLLHQGSATCAVILESILTTLLYRMVRQHGASLPNPSRGRTGRSRPIPRHDGRPGRAAEAARSGAPETTSTQSRG